jgi:lipoprotein-anchoring transpeptidase ErfK/SrfK
MFGTLWSRRVRKAPIFFGIVALSLATAGLSACSSSPETEAGSSTSATSASASSGAEQTPSGRDPVTSTVAPAAPQTQVDSSIIKTPENALAPAVELKDDYVESPKDQSITLQATAEKVRVFASPTSNQVVTTLDSPLPSGTPLTLLVDGQTSTRYKVLLPIRPNGSTGWVNPVDVGIKRTHKYRIEIALGAFTIKVFNGNDMVMDEKIGVGTAETPTPNGRYYIKELLQPPKPDGIYGPFAYGLSGFSPVLQSFNGGDGTIGIHGTNKPELLGTRASHGCIRMRNEAISQLTKFLPLGTPVIIKA